MKKIALIVLVVLAVSCNTPPKDESTPPASSVTLPYTASYSSQFTEDISDEELLTVLNSYKAWENGDVPALLATFGDTLTYISSKGIMSSGPVQEVTHDWAPFRDSLSSVKIEMHAWRKNHSTDKGDHVITVWYDEIDTYKSGKIDSASYHDINVISDGKIILYSQYKRPFVKR